MIGSAPSTLESFEKAPTGRTAGMGERPSGSGDNAKFMFRTSPTKVVMMNFEGDKGGRISAGVKASATTKSAHSSPDVPIRNKAFGKRNGAGFILEI